ncbi:MFS transporter [Elioraea thermophila]|uniref:MFS transporter n=1 Tax=Elioraea thermophila TaxID=2185104 RepID=UPI0013009A6C|nr:MFS transporter [Elioraea thermophila]
MEGTPKTISLAGAASPAVPAVPFALLASVAGIGQVAANMPLPSLPAIGAAFAAPGAELVIAIFLAAFAPAQLVWGPLSDRYGRRPVVLWALGVFAAGSVVCALAPSFAVLLVGRALQAVGGAAGLVIARACLRDGREESSLGRGMAGLSMAIAAVPAFAPLVGALLEQAWSWRAGFWLSSALGAVMVGWGMARFPETNRMRNERLALGAVVRAYRALWADARFRPPAMVAGGAMGGLFAFGAGSPMLYIEVFGLTPVAYALYPLIAVAGVVAGGAAARAMMKRGTPARALALGVAMMLAGGVGMATLEPLGLLGKHAVNVTMLVFVLGLGFALPAAFAVALAPFRDRAGAAASLAGAFQIFCGAAAAALTAVLPMPWVMALCGAGAAAGWLGSRRAEA